MNAAAYSATLRRSRQLPYLVPYLAFDHDRTVAALNRNCYLTRTAIAGLEGDIVKSPIFLVIASVVILVAIAGLAISSARLIGLF